MAIRNTCPKIFPNYNLSRFISDMAPTCKKRTLLDILPNDVDSATILDIEKEAMRLSLPDIPLHLLQGVTLGLLRWKLGHSYKMPQYLSLTSITRDIKQRTPPEKTYTYFNEWYLWLMQITLVIGPFPQWLLDTKPPCNDLERVRYGLVQVQLKME